MNLKPQHCDVSAEGGPLWLLITLITFGGALAQAQELHGTAAFYAALSREMLELRNFLAPFEGPHAYLLKPPLALWLSAASSALFGINDFAMTLPSRLGGLACAWLTYLLASRLYGRRAGWLAALVFVTNGIYIQFTANFRMDSLMTGGALLSLWGYLNLPRSRAACALFGGLAIAALTKGPMVFAMSALFLPHAYWSAHWRTATRREWAWMLLLLIPAAWYAYLYGLHGAAVQQQLNEDFWRGDTAIGLTAVQSAALEYGWKPLRRLWPWLPFMLWALFDAVHGLWKRQVERQFRADIVLILSLLALNLGIAVIKPDPDVRYLYPSLPLLAIFTGSLLSRLLGPRALRWSAQAVRGCAAGAVLVIAAMYVRSTHDRHGLETFQKLAGERALTAINTVIINENITSLNAPRRNDPVADSVYYYTGLKPQSILWPKSREGLPHEIRYFVTRRTKAYQATLATLGLKLVARSTKLVVFER